MNSNPLLTFAHIWTFGLITLGFTAIYPVIFLLGRVLRGIGIWIEREAPQKDRWEVKVILFAIFGLLLGGVAQGWFDTFSACRNAGYATSSCLFLPFR